MGTSEIENENHMLFICDLYAPIRSKLLKTLHCTVNEATSNSSNNDQELEDIRLALQNISNSSLHKDFPKLQSPSITTAKINCIDSDAPSKKDNVTATTNIAHFSQHEIFHEPLQFHFNPQSDQNSTFLNNIRSYIHNALSSFTRRCFDKRASFLTELSKNIDFNDID